MRGLESALITNLHTVSSVACEERRVQVRKSSLEITSRTCILATSEFVDELVCGLVNVRLKPASQTYIQATPHFMHGFVCRYLISRQFNTVCRCGVSERCASVHRTFALPTRQSWTFNVCHQYGNLHSGQPEDPRGDAERVPTAVQHNGSRWTSQAAARDQCQEEVRNSGQGGGRGR